SLIAKKKYSTSHHMINISYNEALTNIEELIEEFKTFDPIFLKNSVVQLIGFKIAKEMNINSLVIGDGADELFAGYNFLHKYTNEPERLEKKINSIIQNMDFFSIKFSNKLGLKIFLPFLQKEITEFSQKITLKEKISKKDGTLYGKFFLRKCYEDILGKEIVWREKNALEKGSGVTNLKYHIENNIITDSEYIVEGEKANSEGVEIRNKEHLYFYRIYRKFFKPPREDITNESNKIKECPFCKSVFSWKGNFCKVCGGHPVNFIKSESQ
ncbi:MAG TPA: asparagine synthase-related protein, partial [Candidatus Nitrosocosmicus sp.]|nr:asparagine synthase-related protein [Candidatus Nitrosocosmicus sp.]